MNTPLRNNQELIEKTIALAELWQNRANELMTKEEQVNQEKMLKMLSRPMDKVTLMEMLDQSFRSHSDQRVAEQVRFLLEKNGIPSFFSSSENFLVQAFLKVGKFVPKLAIPMMKDRLRKETSLVIIPGEEKVLKKYLNTRKSQGIQMNINHLGEALLGEDEAKERLGSYLAALRSPEIEYISVKISTIYSQISSLAFEHTLDVLVERFSQLYRAAQENFFVQQDGTKVRKFVNLDMEEYRDMEITVAAFKRTLDLPEFHDLPCGIVLQAYLPDSFLKLEELTTWAQERVAQGGAPIKVRIVKGANMEMERLESALHDWPVTPFSEKIEADANYKKMVEYGTEPARMKAVHLGIASHNLFELAYAYLVAKEKGVTQYLKFEMLEGMADHVRRAVREITGEVLVYAPEAKREQFINAIAYLVRRLDENTAEENFLRHSFDLQVGSKPWNFLKNQFIESVRIKDTIVNTPNRTQDRNTEDFSEAKGAFYDNQFSNEPDTDFDLQSSRIWAESIRDRWMKNKGDAPIQIATVISGKEIHSGRSKRTCIDTSRPNEEIVLAEFALPTWEDAQEAVATAKADPDGWRSMDLKGRHKILSNVANELRKVRGDLMGAAAAANGKVFVETDVEVSEAIDFAEYYIHSVKEFDQLENISIKGKGVGLIIPPWNFPVAIPCGGVLSALASGNTVILKPAASAILAAWTFCQAFWKAGVSKNTLQFLPSPSSTGVPGKLVKHPDIDFIILTGGTDTALGILKSRPSLLLAAETGGKDATIVTALSDRDQAIKNIIHSAFSNCGQKCSATSLLILETEVYNDKDFQRQLVDAARSYTAGSVWNFANKIGPMNSVPSGDLKIALERLDNDEFWALEPKNLEGNPYLWSPGIKWDVQPGSYSHMTEFFGPVLSVIRADNLEHAINLVNQTGFGLTSGLESLDEREQKIWKDKIKAGNLYINRVTTGAIVLRQPFGGMGKSAIGAGIKCGGPNYVSQFMDYEETAFPKYKMIHQDHTLAKLASKWETEIQQDSNHLNKTDLEKSIHAIRSYLYQAGREFYQEKDYFKIPGQDNLIRYLAIGKITVRLHENDSLFDLIARVAAVRISRSKLAISIPLNLQNEVVKFLDTAEGKELLGAAKVVRQSDQELIDSIPTTNRIRYAAPDRVPQEVYEAAAAIGFYIARNQPLVEGRIELLQYFQEQAISHDYHRYGNLGVRALQQ